MLRITKMSGSYYGVEFTNDFKKEMEEITTFVLEGTPVIIVDSEKDLQDLGILEDVTMVIRD